MRKNSAYIIIVVFILIVIFIGRYLFKDDGSDYYKDYNRVISEPDSIKVIGDDF